MDFSKKVNLIIYRFKEKGLEIFLENLDQDDQWQIPAQDAPQKKAQFIIGEERLIELDPVQNEGGDQEEAWAVEGEWHDIPSLKSMLYEDAVFLKDQIKHMEKGGFITIKEAFKKVMPHQYQFLKELKDILTDRNSVKDL
ncbi:MAG: hypothetical protein Sapg2KO_20590 [Saprospiraceae bacterium]